jgi:hypothetical protein
MNAGASRQNARGTTEEAHASAPRREEVGEAARATAGSEARVAEDAKKGAANCSLAIPQRG